MSFLLMLVLTLASCSKAQQEEQRPVAKSDSTKQKVQPQPMTITEVLKKYTDTWMAIPGVIGTGEGRTDDNKPSVIVFAEQETEAIKEKIPRTIEGFPVVIEVTGEVRALDR
jgi:hypothetical protein